MPRGRNQVTNTNVVTVAETVAATLAGISAPAGDNIDIDATVDITLGAGTTSLTMQVRRNGLGGAIVGQPVTATVTAGNRVVLSFQASDQLPADVAGAQYVVTVTCNAATANSTVNSGTVSALF